MLSFHELPTLLHPEFDAFCSRYAPAVWGLIGLAQLPAAHSETILTNTFLKAWQQHQQTSLPNTYLFAQILRLAYQEGLPINPLSAVDYPHCVFSYNRRACR